MKHAQHRTIHFPSVAALACLLLAALSAWAFFGQAQAQLSVSGRGKDFVAPVTDAQGRRSVLRGAGVTPLGRSLVEITNMQAVTYRGQEKDMIVEAPQCIFDTKANLASSPGRLVIRTADERFSIQGKAFHWQMGDSRLSSKLVISNEVRSLVRKHLLTPKSASTNAPGARQAAVAPAPSLKTGSPGGTNEFIEIRSERFEYEGDAAVYRGKVRAHDEEGDLNCEVLKVSFKGESAGLEQIEAEQSVVLQQGTTRATADKAVYMTGQDKELVEFSGHAMWQEGQREGSGERISFDRRNRILHSEENAYLKLPRSMFGGAGLLLAAPAAGQGTNATTGFVEVFSDLMTIQLPETNGPVRRILAEKNVLIVDSEQDGRALADKALYTEQSGRLELTGSPILETQHRLVNGKVLSFDPATKVFTAAPDAYVKLPFQAIADLGLVSAAGGAKPPPPARTNQFIEVWARAFEYHTNLLRFRDDVRANFLEGDLARGKLTCGSMVIGYGDRVESMEAENGVELEQFAVPEDPHPVVRQVHCELLRAKFTPQGRLEMAIADHGVTAEQEEVRSGQPTPVRTKMTSETVTAFFSGSSNRVDHVVADRNVVFTQEERTARGAKAVYTELTGLMELTGEPTATMPEGKISNADRLVWDRVHGRLIGKGKFRSEWKRAPGSTNRMEVPLLSTQQHR